MNRSPALTRQPGSVQGRNPQARRPGSAVLLSSHQMNLVEELCHSIFLIHHGKRVLYGSLYDIKASTAPTRSGC